jgi:hypothetical protein
MKFPPDKHMLDDGLRDSLLEARPVDGPPLGAKAPTNADVCPR